MARSFSQAGPSSGTYVEQPINSLDGVEKTAHTSGLFGSIFLLSATTLGAGILAIPYTFNLLGYGQGLFLLVFFAIATMYSIWMLLVAGEKAKVSSYEDLAEAAFPHYGRIIMTIFIDVAIFGALTSFLVIIGSELFHTVELIAGIHEWYTSREFLLVTFVVLIVFPLTMLKHISLLEYSSFAAVFIIFAFTVVMICLGSKRIEHGEIRWEDVRPLNLDLNSIFKATPVVSLAYTCQTSVFPVWRELRDPTVSRMHFVQMVATTIACILYMTAGFFGYILYPVDTISLILDALPSHYFYLGLRLAFAIAIVFHYPIVHYAFRNSLEVTVFRRYKFSWIRHTIETVVVLAATTGLAIVVKSDLSKVFDLTGAVAAFPIDFILPVLCFAKICYYDKVSDDEHDEILLGGVRPKNRWRNLATPQLILPFLMLFVATIASIISLITIIRTEYLGQ